jgi:hypothetical protein
MNKTLKRKSILILVLILFCLIITGCNKEQTYISEMTEEMANNIKHACSIEYNVTVDEIEIHKFHGSFDDASVVEIYIYGLEGTTGVTTFEVAGIEFTHGGNPRSLVVVYQNNVYGLKEAYENGILTKSSLEKLPKEF